MTISTIYNNFLIEDIIKESLRRGRVLSRGEIDSALEQVTSGNPDLDEPFTQRDIYKTEEGESLSVSKMAQIMEIMQNDLSVCYRALTDQASSVTSTYDTVISEFKSIEKRVQTLEEKAANLLIVSRNAEGYLDYVSDTFTTKEKVDTLRSDVFVDNKVGVVTLEPKQHSRIPMPVISSDLQFNVITRNQLTGVTLAPGSNVLNAFSDEDTTWLQRVEMSRGVGNVTTDLIVRMPDATSEISKIVFTPSTSDEGNVMTVTLQYSNDGLNWFNVDGGLTQRIQGRTTMIFSATKAAYWKFIMDKAGYDEFRGDSYIYEFGAKTIQFYGVQYRIKQNALTGTLYSKVLTTENNADFNRVSLKTCESRPSNTNINYFVAALTPAEINDFDSGALAFDDINFQPISPLDREDTVEPKLINFKNIGGAFGIDSIYDKNAALDFRYSNDYNTLIDYVVPTSIVQSELEVYRNTGDNTTDGGSNDPVLVNGIPNGWSFDGTFYSCEFYIDEDSGKTIDFGENGLFIDNQRVSGKVVLAKGNHTAKTEKRNWRSISPSTMTTTDNPDILYPYNHKYLIEGIGDILYGDDLTVQISGISKKEIIDPRGIYQGVRRYWERSLEEITVFDFTQNVENDNYSVFAFVKDSNGDDRIMIKDSTEPGLLTNEKLAIITKAISNDLHRGIILKAVFSSEDQKVTPVLDEYIIRLGF